MNITEKCFGQGLTRPFGRARFLALSLAVALVILGLAGAEASANEPIVGLWQITVSAGGTVVDHVISGWTSDGLEFDQDIAPILSGYVCYGHWIKLKGHSYGLTHPFFDFNSSNGTWATTSGYFDYTITVSNDGKTFTGKENGVDGVPGPNPYASGGTPFRGLTLSATKIEVHQSLLP